MDYQNNGPVRSGDYGTASPQYGNSAPLPSDKKGLAVAALIFGILSIIGFCCCLNVITAPIALILGIISLATHRGGKGMAITGIVFALLSILIIGMMLFSVRDVLPYSEQITTDYMQLVNDQDEVFPAYEADGTLPPYIQKYKEEPLKQILDKRGITVEQIMDILDQNYKNGQLPKYDFSVPDSQPAASPAVDDAAAEPVV